MVQEGRHAAIDVWANGEAALWSVSLVCGAGGDRAPSRSGLLHAGGRSPARASGIDNLQRAAAQRRHPKRRPRVSCDDSVMARRARCSPPKAGEAERNAALRTYVENASSGVVAAPSGSHVPGPVVSWKSRRHGPNAWSPEQIARRLPVDFADDATMRISHETIYQALFVQGRSALRRELDGLPAHRARVADAEGAHARARQGLHLSRDHDQPTSGVEADRAVPGHWEGDLILVLAVRRSAPWWSAQTRFSLCCYTCRAWRAMATRLA